MDFDGVEVAEEGGGASGVGDRGGGGTGFFLPPIVPSFEAGFEG